MLLVFLNYGDQFIYNILNITKQIIILTYSNEIVCMTKMMKQLKHSFRFLNTKHDVRATIY